jgi:hypothetical protein
MVVKYAMGEKDIIVLRKGKEEAEKKLLVNILGLYNSWFVN